MWRRRLRMISVLAGLACLAGPPPAWSWTPKSQLSIARQGARLAPPDLYHQILRHEAVYRDGVLAPFRDGDAGRHQQDPNGAGRLEEVLDQEIRRAVDAIVGHRPFRDVVYQLGVVSHFVGDANNPLNTSSADSQEGRYFSDYVEYMESVEPRLRVVFYGVDSRLAGRGQVAVFLRQTLERARSLYPFIGREYRRVGRLPGSRYFDDRSTAFGVASVSFSRAVSDVSQVLRYIWITAGGADWRTAPTVEEERLLVLSRSKGR